MFLLLFLLTLPVSIATNSVPIPLHMDNMLNAGRNIYDKQSTPTQHLGVPTILNLSMYIEGLSSFRTQTMDFQLDVYFQQFWRDERLKHNETKRILIRDKSILQKIWHPDVYFANARIAEFHEVTQPNFLLWVEPDGSILYDTRVSMIVMCSMNLAKWPLDSQQCHLRILSYAYDINQLKIAWNEVDPITRNLHIEISDMRIDKLVPGLCDGNYSTGVWSCVTAEFFVRRQITHHIMQSYVPTSLIVVISWFSFWLDVEAVPARVSLAITTLLTLSTQASTARMALPDVSYAKAIDVWSSTCMLFVFGVMIEFTICNFVQRQAMMKNSKEPGNGRRKSCVGKDDFNNQQNFGTKAKNFFDRAIGRSNEQKHLIENFVEEYGTGSNQNSDRRSGIDITAGFDNEGLDCSSFSNSTTNRNSTKIKKTENNSTTAPSTPNPFPVNFSGSIKSNSSERWRERQPERLANWTKTNSSSSPPLSTTDQNNVGTNLWNRLKTQTVSSGAVIHNEDGPEKRQLNGKLKLTRVVGIGEKWSQALKQMQRNKKLAARHEAKKIDQISRWTFPLAFSIFNGVYWVYYLYIT